MFNKIRQLKKTLIAWFWPTAFGVSGKRKVKSRKERTLKKKIHRIPARHRKHEFAQALRARLSLRSRMTRLLQKRKIIRLLQHLDSRLRGNDKGGHGIATSLPASGRQVLLAMTKKKRVLGLVFLLVMLVAGWFVYQAREITAAWWNEDYHYRRAITIDGGMFVGTLQDFPVLVKVSGIGLPGRTQEDGDDIVFVDSRGSLMDFEIEEYTYPTDELVAWVRMDEVNEGEDQLIYLYYGNSQANSMQDLSGTWKNDFQGVYHINEDGTGTRYDSSQYGNDMTSSGYDGDEATDSGKIAGADDFDGSNDYLGTATGFDGMFLHTNDFTINAWIDYDSISSNNAAIVAQRYGTSMYFGITSAGYLQARLDDSGGNSGSTVGSGWHHVALVYDGSATGGFFYFYIDGQSDGSYWQNDTAVANSGELYIGEQARTDTGYPDPFDGMIDEVQISTSTRSADWIETSFRTQASSTEFLIIGDEEKNDLPIGYWSFDEGYGSVAHDRSANANHGAINGATWAEEQMCKSGRCLYFDNANVEIPNASSLGATDEITIEAWVKPLALSGEQAIVYKGGIVNQQSSSNSTTTVIYRSSGGYDSTDIASTTDAGITLTISGSTATFSAPLPDRVGVGDGLQYDANGDSAADAIVFIHGRSSSTVYTVKTATGSPPTSPVTGDTDWEIHRAYTVLNYLQTGNENDAFDNNVEDFDSHTAGRDLQANNEQWNIALYGPSYDNWTPIFTGWNTGPDNYLRFYTPTSTSEVGVSQRHNGTWTDDAHMFSNVSSGTYIWNQENYARFDGLQMRTLTQTGTVAGIRSEELVGAADVRISNCLIKGANSSVYNGYGISITDNNSEAVHKVWNNIIWNMSSWGIRVSATGGDVYVYNNTIYGANDNYECISGANCIAKNNISLNSGSGDDWKGVWNEDESEYNAGYESTIPGSTDISMPSNSTSTAFLVGADFIDEVDFRLASGSPGADLVMNAGANLSNDPYLSFNTDISGQERGNNGGWDVGADEYHPFNPTKIYRSAGYNQTTALDSGTTDGNVLSIYGDVATFATATPLNVGVGDVIQYDVNGDSAITAADDVCFIHKRIDSYQFIVKDKDGGMPTEVESDTDWDIFRSYTSATLAETGNENDSLDNDLEAFEDWSGGNDLIGKNLQWNIVLYADAEDPDNLYVDGWATGPEHYLRIFTPYLPDQVGTSQRHDGKWNSNAFTFNDTNSTQIIIRDNYVKVDGIQFDAEVISSAAAGLSTSFGYIDYSNKLYIENSLFRKSGSGASSYYGHGLSLGDQNNARVVAANNVFYNFTGDGSSRGIYTGWRGEYWIYNNTFYNIDEGLRTQSGSPDGFHLINNVFLNVTNPISDTGYINATTSSHMASSDGDLVGQNQITLSSTAATDYFVSATDFHIDPTATYVHEITATGTDMWVDALGAYNVRNDIDMEARSTTMDFPGFYTVGADQHYATKIMRSVAYDNTSANDSGSSANRLTISGSVAVFEQAVDEIVGVGDVIQYDVDKNGTIDSSDALAFIYERVSPREYVVKTATGSIPFRTVTQDDNWDIFRAYTRLHYVDSGTENTGIDSDLRDFDGAGDLDIEDRDEQWDIACYDDGTRHYTYIYQDGWDTSTTSYIRYFTPYKESETGKRQRHNGVYSTDYFRINSAAYFQLARIADAFVRIEGLQFYQEINTGDGGAIHVIDSSNEQGDVRIYDNIVRGPSEDTYYHRLIWFDEVGNGSIIRVWNNIVYDCGSNADSFAIPHFADTSIPMYAYNNTIRGCNRGLTGVHIGRTIYAKNNIVQYNTSDYDSSNYGTGSSHNAGYDNEQYTGDNYISLTSNTMNDYFVTSITDDFHIDNDATYASEIMATGTDLSQDPYISITHDIDGEPRNGRVWIGADMQRVKKIYRSVGPGNTSAVASTTEDNIILNLYDSIAYFSADLPLNVGVGDVLQYDADSDGDIDTDDKLAMIVERISASEYRLRDVYDVENIINSVYGDRDWQIFRAHTSLAYGEDGTENTGIDSDLRNFTAGDRNILDNNEQWNLVAYADGEDTTDLRVLSWTTGRNHYLRIYTPTSTSEVGVSQRHSGKWDDTKFVKHDTNDGNIRLDEEYIFFDGIQINSENTDASGHIAILMNSQSRIAGDNEIQISNCIIKETGAGSGNITAINIQDPNIVFKMWNNIIYDFDQTSDSVGIYHFDAGYHYVYNNTFYNNGWGNRSNGGSNMIYKNNISFGNTTTDYHGTFHASSTHNASYDGSAPDTNEIELSSDSATDYFVSASDFHINATSTYASEIIGAAQWLNTDTEHAFTSDIDGETRVGWDLGADNISNSGGGEGSIYGRNYQLGLANDELKFTWNTTSLTSTYSEGANLIAGEWNHVAYKRDSTGEYYYVNGLLASQSNQNETLATTTGPLYIGSSDATSTSAFTGWIDEVRVFDYARTPDEVLMTYAAGQAGASVAGGVSAALGDHSESNLTEGLVGYWKMDEAVGTWNGTADEVVDSSGKGNHGVATGDASTTPGKFGNGGGFNGSGDYVDIGAIDFNYPITYSAWIKTNSVSTAQTALGRYYNGFMLGVYSSDSYRFNLYIDDTNHFAEIGNPTVGVWAHLAATYDGQKLVYYIDGVEAYSEEVSGSLTQTNSDWEIGASGNGSTNFDGQIDEVRIYNRALEPREVRELYRWGAESLHQLVYLNFNEGYGSTTYDMIADVEVDSSAVTRTGDVTVITSNDDGSQAVTVPSDAEIAVFAAGYFESPANLGLSSVTLGGDSFTIEEEQSASTGSQMTTLAYLVSPKTGSQTLAWTWDAPTLTEGAVIYVSFYKGIDTSDPIRDSGGEQQTDATAQTGTLSAKSGDIVVAVANGYPDSTTIAWTNATEVSEDVYNSDTVSYAEASPRSDIDITATLTGDVYIAVSGMVLKHTGTLIPGNNGTLMDNTNWTLDGKFGRALEFDGTNDYVLLDENLSGLEEFSVSTWFKTDSSATSENRIYSEGGGSDHYFYINVNENNVGDIEFGLRSGSANSWGGCSYNGGYNDNEWHHVVVMNKSLTSREMYVDGISVCSNSTDITAAPTLTGASVGRMQYGANDYFDGYIDEVRIYNYALNIDEVRVDYNMGKSVILGSVSTSTAGVASSPNFAASGYYCVPGSSDSCAPPVLHLKMDEKTGNTTYDLSGQGNDGSLGGGTPGYMPTWSSGKYGSGLFFDGTDDYVDTGDLSIAEDLTFTYSTWIKTTQVSGTWKVFMTEGGATAHMGFLINHDSVEVQAQARNDAAAFQYVTSDTGITNNQWHHVAMTGDGTTLRLYVDGNEEGTPATFSGTYSFNTSGLGRLSRGAPCCNSRVILDDVKIYDYTRTPAQLAWDYNRGQPIAHWKFDECQGGTIHDNTENRNHGTLNLGSSGNTATGTCATSSGSFWYEGRDGVINSAGSFDGTDDIVNMGTPSTLENVNNFSYGVWINPISLGLGSIGVIIDKGIADTSLKKRLVIINSPASAIRFVVDRATTDGNVDAVANTIELDTWQFFMVTYDGTDGPRIYKNGIEVSYSTRTVGSGAEVDDSSSSFGIGNDIGQNQAFDGLIDEVKVWNYTLTPLQVKTEYNGGSVRFGN